jgi:hypothetical protein
VARLQLLKLPACGGEAASDGRSSSASEVLTNVTFVIVSEILSFFFHFHRQTANPDEDMVDDEYDASVKNPSREETDDGEQRQPTVLERDSSIKEAAAKITRSQSLSNCLAKKNMQSRMRAASDLLEQHKVSHINLKRLKEQQSLKNSIRKSKFCYL